MATNMKNKELKAADVKAKRPYAVAKYVRVSPYKVRTVLALIRGKDYKEAKATLEHITNGSALAVKRCLFRRARTRNTISVWTEAICTWRNVLRTALPL